MPIARPNIRCLFVIFVRHKKKKKKCRWKSDEKYSCPTIRYVLKPGEKQGEYRHILKIFSDDRKRQDWKNQRMPTTHKNIKKGRLTSHIALLLCRERQQRNDMQPKNKRGTFVLTLVGQVFTDYIGGNILHLYESKYLLTTWGQILATRVYVYTCPRKE